MFQVSGFRFQVSGFRFQVSGFRFQVWIAVTLSRFWAFLEFTYQVNIRNHCHFEEREIFVRN
ncbi:hypothetical protein [Flavobacterium sp. Leaf82]|uniref:hypothetical protein n=1 Tax=Flavobacterium sp. Leaf82 TaxID=1736238 RepID=UPI000AB81A1E|nr:hypothetical protein [Flavobacterium sp. Leaf82]